MNNSRTTICCYSLFLSLFIPKPKLYSHDARSHKGSILWYLIVIIFDWEIEWFGVQQQRVSVARNYEVFYSVLLLGVGWVCVNLTVHPSRGRVSPSLGSRNQGRWNIQHPSSKLLSYQSSIIDHWINP